MIRSFRVLGLAGSILIANFVFAQAPAAPATPAPAPTAAPAAPVAKPVEAPPEPTDVQTFTFASNGELADFTQQFSTLFSKLSPKATKEHPAAHAPKFTSLNRNMSVLVRGTKAELEQVGTMVKLLQGSMKDAKGPQLTKLKTARCEDVLGALATLELEDSVLCLRGLNALVLMPTTEANQTQIKKVIEAFEKVDAKTAATTKPTTKNDD